MTTMRAAGPDSVFLILTGYPRASVTLDVHELFQDVLHFNEIPRMLHHLIDVLVCARNLVKQHFRMPVLDACHRPAQVIHTEERTRFGSRIAPAGAMGGRVEAHWMFLP